ncbi:hypothetical protein LX36DRAFT_652164 [Colletotrichum falcatum]|nr:hypothetical protein LX36DRAFT_652164 [Colletotrichum falcatum]
MAEQNVYTISFVRTHFPSTVTQQTPPRPPASHICVGPPLPPLLANASYPAEPTSSHRGIEEHASGAVFASSRG